MEAHFEPVVNAYCRLVAPPPTKRTGIGGYPKVASCDMLGEQLHYSNLMKHGYIVASSVSTKLDMILHFEIFFRFSVF